MSSGQSCTIHGFLDVNECDDEDGSEDGNDSDEINDCDSGNGRKLEGCEGGNGSMMTMSVNVPAVRMYK